MSSVIKFLLAVLTIGAMAFMAFGCETVSEYWPRTKEVMVAEGREAIRDVVENPSRANAAAEALEWFYLVLSALLGASGGAGGTWAMSRLWQEKKTKK